MNTNQKQLMERIDIASFTLDDLVLFLDTHPDCREAMDLYQQQMEIRRRAMQEYSERFGPLDKYQVNTCQGWSWTETPWPWEGEC